MGKEAIAPLGSLWQSRSGGHWTVCSKRPGGHITLFNKEESLFIDTYVKQLFLGEWKRITHDIRISDSSFLTGCRLDS